jgi:hypothetical protein
VRGVLQQVDRRSLIDFGCRIVAGPGSGAQQPATDFHAMTPRFPGADEDGLVPVATLRKAALALDATAFVRRYPLPGLLFLPPEDRDLHPSGEAGADAGSVASPVTVSLPSVESLRYVGRVAFLAKRPGTPLRHMVCLGRTATNDLVVSIRNISKFHGYFRGSGEAWVFVDHGSTTGTLLNDRPLEPHAQTAIRDGDRLRFGLELRALYLLPHSLYAQMRVSG